jgi:hypothetical protein
LNGKDTPKCQLKPIDPKDYKAALTAEQVQQLRQGFPGGVRDYSKAGVNQVRLVGTYQKLPHAAPGRSSTTSAQR